MDFDDAIKKDKRKFLEFLLDNLKINQITLNTFNSKEPLKPRTIKIMLYILDLDLYLFINGLFFNEEYISNFLHEKNTFFKFIERLSERFLYIALVGIIISYIIDFFFIEEKKIKGIFKREKDDKIVLKEEIITLIESMQKRYLLFIIIVFFILLLSFFYLLCFNYVYPKTQIEWVKSSITIMIIMQFLSVLKVLLETVLRFLSFRFKSERIYKISKLID